MYRQSSVAALYIAYAALTIGLLVTSLLSPLHHRTIGDRSLRVYGVMIVYNNPPPTDDWTPDPSDSSSSSASSSSLSSSFSSSLNGSSSMDSNSSTENETDSTSASGGSDENSGDDSGNVPASLELSDLHAHLLQLWHITQKYSTSEEDGTETSSRATSSAVVGSSSGGSSSSSSDAIVRFQVSVSQLSSLQLGRLMIAHLAFAGASLVFSLILIFAAILHLVPDAQWIKLSLVTLTLFLLSVLCNFFCTIIGAVLMTNHRLYMPIAKGYYARTFEIGYKHGISSGLSSAIAALVLSVVTIPVMFFSQRQ